jgi:hypothetical protein
MRSRRAISGIPRWCERLVAGLMALAMVVVLAPRAHAAERGANLGLRMRSAPDPSADPPPVAVEGAAPVQGDDERSPSAPRDDPDGAALDSPRPYAGPTAVVDVPGREASWNDPRTPAPAPDAPAAEPPAPAVTASVPPPSSVRQAPAHIVVAVGLAPEAPGSRDEKALLSALEATLRASENPTTDVRRLRPGAGAPHRICREQREDLVVMIGYVADRPTPVVLTHDCRLDRALGMRAAAAAHEPGLAAALWSEHQQLVQAGARERRRLSVGPKARAGIIAGVAIAVVAVAVGALVASASSKETVVITVRP